ncbi:WPP domain protein 2 [Perilla frutescens var. frutescens]|nr:WPP domain protein 2 [Perilla frutescens var. frutescens]
MTETEHSATAGKLSFSIWPPNERTRDAVRNRLIESFSTPSLLSNKYGTISPEEAVEAADHIEEEAYEAAGKLPDTNHDGIEILQFYSKEISQGMLNTMKARSAQSVAPETPSLVETTEGDDAASISGSE